MTRTAVADSRLEKGGALVRFIVMIALFFIESIYTAICSFVSRRILNPLGARARAQAFVDALMKADFEPIASSQGMTFLRNIPDLETGKKGTIIVRNMTDAFWEACIRMVNTPGSQHRVAAVGTRGIGKTTSTPILIRKLLEDGNTVVYCVRTESRMGWYYEFVRIGEKYVARVYPEFDPPESGTVPSLRMPSTYFIVDPGVTMDSCNPIDLFQPKVIIVASLCDGHWGGSKFYAPRQGLTRTFKYYPTWSRKELEDAALVLRPDLNQSLVHERFAAFGGVPGSVFASDRVTRHLIADQDRALAALEECDVRRIVPGHIVGTALFFSNDSPAGALMGFDVLPENFDAFDAGFNHFVSHSVHSEIH
jgi:hypothetical protein